jgi:biopolymer transport protein ExbD
MRLRRIPKIAEAGVNVTPLIDVVMCMIVFFMLAAKIGIDTGIDRTINLPTSVVETDIKSLDMGNSLTLNIRPGAADQPEVTALLHGHFQELRLTEPGTDRHPLADSLRYFRYGRDLLPGGWGVNSDNPAFNVIIRGERDMDYKFLEPVLMACAQANVKSVSFQTQAVRP